MNKFVKYGVVALVASAGVAAVNAAGNNQGADGTISCSAFSATYEGTTYTFTEAVVSDSTSPVCVGLSGGNDKVSSIPSGWNVSGLTLYRDNQTSSSSSDSSRIDVQLSSSSQSGIASALFNFGANFSGDTVFGLKFGAGSGDSDADANNDWGLWLIQGVNFASGTTMTFSWNTSIWNGTNGGGLSHGSVYGTLAPIPEPETYALMLAGLGAVAFVARRRKAAGSKAA